MGWCVLEEGVLDLLGAVAGDFDTNMRLFFDEDCLGSSLLGAGDPVALGAQEAAVLLEGDGL